jgi:hypothetical protein
MMPPGWSRYLVDDDGKRALIARTSERMRALSRPDLDAQARTLVEVQWRRLQRSGVTAVFLPGESDDVLPPSSIAVRQHVAPVGTAFADSVASFAAAALERFQTPIGPILRWVVDTPADGELSAIRSRNVGYGIPLPGEGQRRGLVFLVAIPYPQDADPRMVEAMTEAADTIMETFRWR